MEITICDKCGGTGVYDKSSRYDGMPNYVVCSKCGGTGRMYKYNITYEINIPLEHKDEMLKLSDLWGDFLCEHQNTMKKIINEMNAKYIK